MKLPPALPNAGGFPLRPDAVAGLRYGRQANTWLCMRFSRRVRTRRMAWALIR